MRMWIGLSFLSYLILASSLVGYALSEQGTAASALQLEDKDLVQFSGKVVYVTLEGGFWGLVSDEGTQYDPGTLPQPYRRDGLGVRVKAKILRDVVTFRMWGQRVELLLIETSDGAMSGHEPHVSPRH